MLRLSLAWGLVYCVFVEGVVSCITVYLRGILVFLFD